MEIKKAWERFKREIKKELNLTNGFYLNTKQLKNRTATYLICNATPYDMVIAGFKEGDARVQSYDTWTPEEKANYHTSVVERVEATEAAKAKYGTKRNEADLTMKAVITSRAFSRFSQELGAVVTELEEMNGCYYIRFHY